jgi:hypothetical protein
MPNVVFHNRFMPMSPQVSNTTWKQVPDAQQHTSRHPAAGEYQSMAAKPAP